MRNYVAIDGKKKKENNGEIVFKRNLLLLWNGNISIVLSVFYGP